MVTNKPDKPEKMEGIVGSSKGDVTPESIDEAEIMRILEGGKSVEKIEGNDVIGTDCLYVPAPYTGGICRGEPDSDDCPKNGEGCKHYMVG
ncbi:hypothetical protein GOV12_01615 [Candidatus Pacearchaeota archaeon]|nr:hypothetical protein [Candidatus Pacearchaeota archaeon]